MSKVYTIGYAGFNIEEFIHRLKMHGINALIDVRSKPYSSYHKDYNMDNLIKALNANDIVYRNYSEGFGAWQNDKQFFTKLNDDEMYLDFEKFRESNAFKGDFAKIMEGIDLNYTFGFMCSEIDPMRCHRNIMVAKAFSDYGFDVLNIVPKNKGFLISQLDLEETLIRKYKTLSLNEAYNRANIDIAYKITIKK